MLAVNDTGTGMDAETRKHVFEPFFTTKEPLRGTGLGLATVHGIVTQTGGRIYIDSAPHDGTTFSIAFPAAVVEARAEPAPPPPVQRHAPATILLVEDDPAVRSVGSAILAGGGYRVLQVAGGPEAQALTDAFDGRIDLLLTDVVLRGQSGPAIAARLRERRPEMKILFTSGHAEELIAQKGVLHPGVNFLPKPFTRASLLDKVGSVLASPARGELGMAPSRDGTFPSRDRMLS
jgi:CheY-like chemotaxis protein